MKKTITSNNNVVPSKLHSAYRAGTVWFQPTANVANATIRFTQFAGISGYIPPYQYPARIRVFDGQTQICSTIITGISDLGNPVAEECNFETGGSSGLYHAVLAQNSYWGVYTRGLGSFFAPSESDWFTVSAGSNTQINPTLFLNPIICSILGDEHHCN